MMISFYRPEGKRTKIMLEGGVFPSDYYAVEAQLKLHGYDWKEHMIELIPREGEHYPCERKILSLKFKSMVMNWRGNVGRG